MLITAIKITRKNFMPNIKFICLSLLFHLIVKYLYLCVYLIIIIKMIILIIIFLELALK